MSINKKEQQKQNKGAFLMFMFINEHTHVVFLQVVFVFSLILTNICDGLLFSFHFVVNFVLKVDLCRFLLAWYLVNTLRLYEICCIVTD